MTSMAMTRQRGHQIVVFLAYQICLLAFVDSFSTTIIRPKATIRHQRRQCTGVLQTFLTTSRPVRKIKLSPLKTTSTASSRSVESDESSNPSATEPINGDEKLDMPWSDAQEWALKDNLAKYTVIIRPPITGGTPERYAMWRTLTRDVPELAGYPIPFLIQMHQRINKNNSSNGKAVLETPGVLPMLDDFEFTPNGGVSGRAYGLPGVAYGTRIQTPSLVSAETTVPLGYVTTRGDSDPDNGSDDGFSYELGTCSSSSAYSLDGTERSAAIAAARRLDVEGAVESSRRAADVAREVGVTRSGLLSDAEANRDLAYLGGATAMLLASATAVGMLSHHLTVNVFWV